MSVRMRVVAIVVLWLGWTAAALGDAPVERATVPYLRTEPALVVATVRKDSFPEHNNTATVRVLDDAMPYSYEESLTIEFLEYTSCAGNDVCVDCNHAVGCHWCSHDDSCHAIGSVHGCTFGASCDSGNDDNNKNNTDTSGCLQHKTCSDCALSSKLCHWCGHDNACHAIGSVYGCVTGVDCYSNERCHRKVPEALNKHDFTFTQMGFLPMMLVILVGSCLFCCLSSCFCVASGVKGAYDDLADLATTDHRRYDGDDLVALGEPLLMVQSTENEPVATDGDSDNAREPTQGQVDTEQPLNVTDEANEDQLSPETEETPLVEGQENNPIATGYVQLCDMFHTPAGQQPELVLAPPRHSIRSRQPRHMQRLYNMCVVMYILLTTLVVGLVVAAIRYYPKAPVYNICNDSVAWKSLIDSMASMKVSADFELLASISNPNHFDVALDMGKGSFTHDHAFVGTFEIPPVTAKAMSITDMMIIASFSPDKWDALSLTAEYYRGKLVLAVDAEATIRVPVLADYSFTTTVKNMKVRVNEMADRSLCACPTWNEPKKIYLAGIESVPDFMHL